MAGVAFRSKDVRSPLTVAEEMHANSAELKTVDEPMLERTTR
jgi:hypothetical protein